MAKKIDGPRGGFGRKEGRKQQEVSCRRRPRSEIGMETSADLLLFVIQATLDAYVCERASERGGSR